MKRCLWPVVLSLLLLAGVDGYAQTDCLERYERVYATSEDDGYDGGLFVSEGDLNIATDAVDEDLNTFSIISCEGGLVGLSKENKWQEFLFDQPISRSEPFHIKFSTKIPLNLLGNVTITISTWNGTSQVSSTILSSGLLGLSAGENMLDYVVAAPGGLGTYNKVRVKLEVNSILVSSAEIKIFEAYYTTLVTSNTNISCNEVVDIIYGTTGALLGSLNEVQSPHLAADGIYSTFSHLLADLSVANNLFITALFNGSSKPGDSVRVLLQKGGGGLLDVDLIADNFNITAYKGNTVVGTLAAESEFLELRLLPENDQIQVLTFKVSNPFDRIEVSLSNGLATALSDLYVYEIERIAPKPTIEAPDLENNVVTICEAESITLTLNQVACEGDVYHWFDAADGGKEITAGVSANGTTFIPTDLTLGPNDFYVSVTRNGCTDEASDRTKVIVQVTEKPPQPTILLANP